MNKISLVFIAEATIVTGCLGYGDPSLTGTGGEGGDTGNGDVENATCVPNETKACLCGPGSVGQQTCDDEGTSFGPCEFCTSEPIPGTGGNGNVPSLCQPGLEYACIIGGEPGYKVCLASGEDYGPCTPRLHCTPGATQCCVADNGRAGVQTCDDDGKWDGCEPFDEPAEGTGGTTGTGGNSGTGGNVETGGNSGTGGATPVQGQVEYILRAVVSADVADYVRNVEFQGMLNRVGWRTFCGTNERAEPEPASRPRTAATSAGLRPPGSILTRTSGSVRGRRHCG